MFLFFKDLHAFASMGSNSKKKPALDNFDVAFTNPNMINPNNNPISNFYFDQFNQNPSSNQNMLNSENNINNRIASKLIKKYL